MGCNIAAKFVWHVQEEYEHWSFQDLVFDKVEAHKDLLHYEHIFGQSFEYI